MSDLNNPEHAMTKKINTFLSKFSYWIVGVVLAIVGSIYTTTVDRISAVETQVQFLYSDKVSKEELKSVTKELKNEVATLKTDILSQQHSMKNDILQRLDYFIRLYPPIPKSTIE